MQVKPWQMIVIILGLLAGIGSIVYILMGSDDPKVNTIVFLVDVENGDMYRANLEKTAVSTPAFHPKTGKLTLMRINKNEQGTWQVSDRDRGVMSQLDKGAEVKAINRETGELIGPPKAPVEYVPSY